MISSNYVSLQPVTVSSFLPVMTTSSADDNDVSQAVLVVLVVMLLMFSACGVLGNALVLLVFSKRKDKLVSIFFILLLASIDFITSLIIMPATAYMEYTRMEIGDHDLLCKLYQFSITSVIPLSALIMAAIAVDRYLCICHPLVSLLNVRRAKIASFFLIALASSLGIVASLIFGVYEQDSYSVTDTTTIIPKFTNTHKSSLPNAIASIDSNQQQFDNSISFTEGQANNILFHYKQEHYYFANRNLDLSYISNEKVNLRVNMSQKTLNHRNGPAGGLTQQTISQIMAGQEAFVSPMSPVDYKSQYMPIKYTGICQPNFIIINENIAWAYQKIYNAIYLVCLIVVVVLYVLIYRSVAARHVHKMRSRSKPSTGSAMMQEDNLKMSPINEPKEESEAVLMLPLKPANTHIESGNNGCQATDKSTLHLSLKATYGPCLMSESKSVQYLQLPSSPAYQVKTTVTSLMRNTVGGLRRSGGKRQVEAMPNIKVAAMLFVVAIVFIVAFLPAFLMSMNVISNNVIVFYMYFAYNIANPFIYSFMNKNFRDELSKRLLRRKRRRAAAAASRVRLEDKA